MDTIFSVFLALFGIFFGCVGFWFFGKGIWNVAMGYVSRNWQPATGKIVSSNVGTNPDPRKSRSGEIISEGQFNYNVEVEYEYYAVGANRKGSRVLFAETSSKNLRQIQSIVQRYQTGKTITVYFDPSKPERSVLEPGIKPSNLVIIITGGLFGLIGGGIAWGGVFGFDGMFNLVGQRNIFRIVTTIGLVGGAAMLIGGIVTVFRASRSQRWPMTTGRVVSSKILQESSTSTGNTMVTRSQYLYKPEVAFEYTVQGIKYLSNMVTFADFATNSSVRADRIVSKYPEGKQVQVFYDPDDPQMAVLEQSTGPFVWVFFAGGLVFLVISSLFILIGPEKFK